MSNFTCQTWNVSYDTTFYYTRGIQSIDVRDVRFLERLALREQIDNWDEPSLTLEGYKSWLDSLINLLTGELSVGGPQDYLRATTNVLRLGVAACPEFESLIKSRGIDTSTTVCPGGSLKRAIENLSQNLTFSFFSYGPAL